VEPLDGVPQPGARHGDPERAARRADQFLGQRSLPGAVHARLSGASGNERPGPARGDLRDLARSVIARAHSAQEWSRVCASTARAEPLKVFDSPCRHPSVSRRRPSRPICSNDNQPELPLAAASRKRFSTVIEPAAAARRAIARRVRPSPVPDHVRLVLTLELRRELAEKLSLKAIKSERNIEAIIIGLIDAAAKQWR